MTEISAIQANPTADASGVDARRYTKFDRSTTDFGETQSLSFGDVLDMVNPLQHIPVVSSAYRAATGENINPVSRVAGDALYGGAFGAISAVIGAVGGAINSALEQGSGHDGVGTMVASLFGGDTAKTATPAVTKTPAAETTMLAASTPPAANTLPPDQAIEALKAQALALAQGSGAATTPAVTSPTPVAPTAIAAASAASNTVTLTNAPHILAALNNPAAGGAGKAFPLDRSKQAYGGVMQPVGDMTKENMDIALSQASPNGLRLGNTIYTSRLMNGPHPLPIATANSAATAPATPAATATTPAATGAPIAITQGQTDAIANSATSAATPGRNPLPQGLIDDMMALRGINQYQNTASGSMSKLGSTVDTAN